MSLRLELEKLKFDKRLLEWHVSRGKLSKAEAQKYLDSLPDLASNVEYFGLGDEHGSSSTAGNGNGASGAGLNR